MKKLFYIPANKKLNSLNIFTFFIALLKPFHYLSGNTNMTITQYISKLEPGRQQLLAALHETILKTNKKVSAEMGKMMGTDMIIYKAGPYFIYGLASQKNYMSLHAMPIYGHKPLHEKYSSLFNKAKVQKGCINFTNADEMPLHIAEQFLDECAKIDMKALMESFKKK